MNKANRIADCSALEQIPNIGPSIASDLRLIGIRRPADLSGQDPYALYDALCRKTGARHDPCVLDTFIAAVCFAEGGPPLPWWHFTAERKQGLVMRAALPVAGARAKPGSGRRRARA
jgi:hypothetical protein